MRSLSLLVAAAVVAGGVAGGVADGIAGAPPAEASVTSPDAAGAAPIAGTYVPVTPFRAVDTRSGPHHSHRGALAHGAAFAARIGGLSRVPTRVAAVTVTITAVSPTGTGGLIAYPAGTKRPAPRNLLYAKGHSTSGTAIVRLARDGRVAIFNAAASGRTHVVIDVSGYYVAGAPSAEEPGILHTVVPRHVVSGRRVAARHATAVAVGAHAGVPASGIGAVAIVVDAAAAERTGALIAYRTGRTRPSVPIVRFARHTAAAGFAIVPTDQRGRIAVFNASAGRVRVGVDVVGYFVGGSVRAAGATRVYDPKLLARSIHLAARHARTLAVSGHAGVPAAGAAAVLVSTLTRRASGAVASSAILPVSKGRIAVRNPASRGAEVAVDVLGYVPAAAAPLTAPRWSMSRYVRTIGEPGDAFAESGTTGDGCVDATAGSTLVLLEFGAQLNDGTGVELSATTRRISYGDLVSAIDQYLVGFLNCSPPAATIALGTNNDGDFDHGYTAAERGRDWAGKVVDAIAPHPGVRVVGANDIEPAFASTRAQAQEWEDSYLATTAAGLVFNGSADGCPTTLGRPGATCAYGWTEQQLYDLAHNGSRIQVLPQVYVPEQAVQWANIDATGGGGLSFAGSLTEYQACPAAGHGCPTASLRPAEGWAALYRAIATVVAAPRIPAATDLRADG